MNRLKNLLLLGAVFGIYATPLAADKLPAAKTLSDSQQRTICFVLPLTGGQAAFGESVMRGAQFAQERNADCKKGDAICQINNRKLIFEDHAGEPAKSVAAVKKLLYSDSCDAFVIFGSPASLAAVDILEKASKLTISIATSDKIQTGKKYIFRSMASAPVLTKPLSDELKRLNIKKVVSITSIHDGMYAYRDALQSEYKQEYLKLFEVNPAETDFKVLALQIHRLNPEAIFITLLPPQGAMFVKQIKALAYQGELFAANQLESPDELKAAGNAFEGLWYTREGSQDSQEFDRAMLKRFPDGNINLSLNGYDSTIMLDYALRQSDPRAALENLKDFQGASGLITTFDDHSFSSSVRLMMVKQGRFVPKD